MHEIYCFLVQPLDVSIYLRCSCSIAPVFFFPKIVRTNTVQKLPNFRVSCTSSDYQMVFHINLLVNSISSFSRHQFINTNRFPRKRSLAPWSSNHHWLHSHRRRLLRPSPPPPMPPTRRHRRSAATATTVRWRCPLGRRAVSPPAARTPCRR